MCVCVCVCVCVYHFGVELPRLLLLPQEGKVGGLGVAQQSALNTGHGVHKPLLESEQEEVEILYIVYCILCIPAFI